MTAECSGINETSVATPPSVKNHLGKESGEKKSKGIGRYVF